MQQVWEALTWLKVKQVIAANHTSIVHSLSSCSDLTESESPAVPSWSCLFGRGHPVRCVYVRAGTRSKLQVVALTLEVAASRKVMKVAGQVYNNGMLSTAMGCVSLSSQIMHGKHTSLGIQACLPCHQLACACITSNHVIYTRLIKSSLLQPHAVEPVAWSMH